MATYAFWPQMAPARAHEILMCAQQSNKKLYRTALDIMAPRLGLRPQRVLELPKLERHLAFAQLLARPEMETLSFNLVSFWLIDQHSDLLSAWLDFLKIPHDEMGCADTFPPSPEEAFLSKGIESLLQKYDQQIVALYLNAFNEIPEVQWRPLAKLLKEMASLQPAQAQAA